MRKKCLLSSSEGRRRDRSFQTKTGTKSEGSTRPGRQREGKVGFPEEVAAFKRSRTGYSGVSQMSRRGGAVSQVKGTT